MKQSLVVHRRIYWVVLSSNLTLQQQAGSLLGHVVTKHQFAWIFAEIGLR